MPHESFFFNQPYFFETEADLQKATAIERECGGDLEEFLNGLASEGIVYSHTRDGLAEARALDERERNARKLARALHKPKTIFSAEDVRHQFLGAYITHEVLFAYKNGLCDVALELDANSDTLVIDGPLTWADIEAISYWREHLRQFVPPPEPARPRKQDGTPRA